MKRVLFYDDVPIYGGHQVTVIAAAQGLAAAGFEVVSAFSSANDRLHEAWKRTPARLIPLDLRLTRWQPFLAPFGIAAKPVRALLRDVAPDVVIAVQGTIVQSNRVVEQCRHLGIPVISFIPTALHFAPGEWLQDKIARLLGLWHYRRANAFITTNENARRELIADGVRAPVRVAYCGADVAALRRLPPTKRDGFTIAIIGRVSFGTKGHDILLRALPLMDDDVRVLVVGDGPDEARIDAQLSPRVERIPWQTDMSAVYSSIDMLAIPSRFEGLPQVALEAMLFELPIAAADMGGIREVLPESWLFPVGDHAALAATVRALRAADLRTQLTAHRERILRELNLEAFGARFVEAVNALS